MSSGTKNNPVACLGVVQLQVEIKNIEWIRKSTPLRAAIEIHQEWKRPILSLACPFCLYINEAAGREELAYFTSRKRSTRLRIRLTGQPPLRGGRRSPNFVFNNNNYREHFALWVLLFLLFIFILANTYFDVNYFLGTSTPTARPGIPTSAQKPEKPTPAAGKGRWCKDYNVLPLHTRNKPSSNYLQYLV